VQEQRSTYSLFDPVCTENEQKVDPQNSVAKDHQFGAPGGKGGRHLFDTGNIHGGDIQRELTV